MEAPIASESRFYQQAPVSLNTTGSVQRAVFRIPLDRHISASEAYLAIPLDDSVGRAVAPLYGGVEALIDTCEAWMGGVSLSTAERHGHRLQLTQAVGSSATSTSSRDVLTGSGGSPDICYTPALDSSGYDDLPGLPDASSYARMSYKSGETIFTSSNTATPPVYTDLGTPVPTWRDAGGLNDPGAITPWGAVRLSRLIPELGVLPMGLLPAMAGKYLEIHISLRNDWAGDRDVGASILASTDAEVVTDSAIRFCSRVFQFEAPGLKKIEDAFVGYQAAYWAWRMSETSLAATASGITQQNPVLGFNGERLGALVLANWWATATDADRVATRVLSDLRASPIGRADTSIQVFADGKTLFSRPLRHAEKWVETARALDVKRLRPPVGSYERFEELDTGTVEESGHLVYDPTTYLSVAAKQRGLLAPFAVDMRMDRSKPRMPSNSIKAGRDGVRLQINRVHSGVADWDRAGTLYAWGLVAQVLSFERGPGGLVMSTDSL